MQQKYVIGIDYGSDSVRAVVVNPENGLTISDGVFQYPRWGEKMYCDPAVSQYRQHPLDYIEGLEESVKLALAGAGESAGQYVVGIGIDTTGSTPAPVDRNGMPLALNDDFKNDPDAMFYLWKDHTSVAEAKEVTDSFRNAPIDYTKFQGVYASEWFWAKILHAVRNSEKIRKAAWTWEEHCDWIVGMLCGNTNPETMYKCCTAAGHKAYWHSEFQGLPAREVLSGMDNYLGLVYDRYGKGPQPAGTNAGRITKEWADRLGICPDAVIGGCSFDAHAGGVGAGVALGTMVSVIGTSSVDMVIEKPETLRGKNMGAFCGLAENSIVPGYIGMEMSQPAFGDAYAWFKNLLMWPLTEMQTEDKSKERKNLQWKIGSQFFEELEKKAADCLDDDAIALDWFNGRRYPYINEDVKSAICGLTLGTKAPELYAALVKGTVFGSRRIFDSLIENGVKINHVICVGGIAKKSRMVMQLMADSFNLPIMVCTEEQVCARGAAIYGAVASGVFMSVVDAQKVFCQPYKANYYPNQKRHMRYETQYNNYLKLGEFVESNMTKKAGMYK